MTIPDEVVSTVRGYITSRHSGTESALDESDRRFAELRRSGNFEGLGVLLLSAFTVAARRKFSPTWYPADIIRYVASVRGSAPEIAEALHTVASENQIRLALGQNIEPYPDMEERGRVQMLLLTTLTIDYSDEDLDTLMSEARALADRSLAEAGSD